MVGRGGTCLGRGAGGNGRGAGGLGRGDDGLGRGVHGTSLRRGAASGGGLGHNGRSSSRSGGGSGQWGTRGTRSVCRPRAGSRGGINSASRGGSRGGSSNATGRGDHFAANRANLDDFLMEGLNDFDSEPLENGLGLNHVDNGLGRGGSGFDGGTGGLNRGGGVLGRGGTRSIESASRSQVGSRGGIRSGSRGGSSSAIGSGDEFADHRVDLNDVLGDGLDDSDSDPLENGRGCNHVDSLPVHPEQRTWIYPLGRGFTDVRVNRQIIAILKTMFNGPWTSWRKVPDEDRTNMWERFSGLYQWESSLSAIVERNWEFILRKRFSDTLSTARKYAMANAVAAGTLIVDDDFEVLKPYHPEWIDVGDWEIMIDTLWNTDEWKKKSKINTKNKATLVVVKYPNILLDLLALI